MEKRKKICIFDTTLRDGEQVPGAKLNLNEKLRIAKQLEILGVDFIEAGFPSSSRGDFEAVRAVAELVKKPVVTALARAVKEDIDMVYESVKHANSPMIHIVLGTSNIHVEQKFRKTSEEILEMGVQAVKYAKTLLPNVQYSTEDASRSEFEYLWKTIEAVAKAGATIINIPDTVGYAVPEQFGELISKICCRLKNLDDRIMVSVHCHNDTGLATANSLIAVKNGADKVECTINGIGERAGNAALEEIVMGLKLRGDYYRGFSGVETRQITNASKMVSSLMGLDVQVNKAITGDNAFAHSSGIHQDGLLKSREVYEIINPKDVGIDDMEMVLTARSGRAALKNTIKHMGLNDLSEADFEVVHQRFLELADKKKEVYYHDLYYLAKDFPAKAEDISKKTKIYELVNYQVISSDIFPSASVKLRCGDELFTKTSTGNGPIDALYSAIEEIVDLRVNLLEYKISSISQGEQAMGRVRIQVKFENRTYTSSAADVDTIKASAIAMLNCINQIKIESAGNCKND
ncbi:MAG: 2-isopropylmalate synthase [Oscillospiraceae bacterium]|nr:2-isopropylmalate synthase [Oscillospiraceae bacterium]